MDLPTLRKPIPLVIATDISAMRSDAPRLTQVAASALRAWADMGRKRGRRRLIYPPAAASCLRLRSDAPRDARTGELLHVLDERSGAASACRFSSDGKLVIFGYGDNSCRIWDANDGKLLSTLVGHNGRVRDIRINPDQTRFVSWATDDKAIVWDFASPVANQLLVLEGDSRLLQAHWSPDGRDIISAWSDGSVKVWSGATREDLGKLVGNNDNFESQFDDWRVKSMNHIAD